MAYTLDDYDVTKEGQVINKHNGHVRKPQPNSKGYLRVMIGGKNLFVHRLVAEKYIPNPDNKEQVNHIDGDKNNNCVENLEWVTNQENRNHAVINDLQIQGERCPWAKLTNEQVQKIRHDYEELHITMIELANQYNVSRNTISGIVNYKHWKSVK